VLETTLLLLSLFSLLAPYLRADDDTPVPPDVQKLVTALKVSDESGSSGLLAFTLSAGQGEIRSGKCGCSHLADRSRCGEGAGKGDQKLRRNRQVTVARAGLVRVFEGQL
jgi:hypothetical protein